MSGGRRQAQLAGGRPLGGGLPPRARLTPRDFVLARIGALTLHRGPKCVARKGSCLKAVIGERLLLSRDPPALAGFDAITVAVQVPNEHESDSSASASWSRQWRFT